MLGGFRAFWLDAGADTVPARTAAVAAANAGSTMTSVLIGYISLFAGRRPSRLCRNTISKRYVFIEERWKAVRQKR